MPAASPSAYAAGLASCFCSVSARSVSASAFARAASSARTGVRGTGHHRRLAAVPEDVILSHSVGLNHGHAAGAEATRRGLDRVRGGVRRDTLYGTAASAPSTRCGRSSGATSRSPRFAGSTPRCTRDSSTSSGARPRNSSGGRRASGGAFGSTPMATTRSMPGRYERGGAHDFHRIGRRPCPSAAEPHLQSIPNDLKR